MVLRALKIGTHEVILLNYFKAVALRWHVVVALLDIYRAAAFFQSHEKAFIFRLFYVRLLFEGRILGSNTLGFDTANDLVMSHFLFGYFFDICYYLLK